MLMLIPFMCSFKVTMTYKGQEGFWDAKRCAVPAVTFASAGGVANEQDEGVRHRDAFSGNTLCRREGMKYQVTIGGRCLSLRFSPVSSLSQPHGETHQSLYVVCSLESNFLENCVLVS